MTRRLPNAASASGLFGGDRRRGIAVGAAYSRLCFLTTTFRSPALIPRRRRLQPIRRAAGHRVVSHELLLTRTCSSNQFTVRFDHKITEASQQFSAYYYFENDNTTHAVFVSFKAPVRNVPGFGALFGRASSNGI